MQFEGLTVDRVIMHEIFKRGADKLIRQPSYADQLEELGGEAMDAFRRRLTEALAPGGKTMEMAIADTGPESFFTRGGKLIAHKEPDFLEESKELAMKLARAQTAPGIPGGQVVLFHGTTGVPAVPYVAAIKAETTAGFRRAPKGNRSIVEYLNNLFLVPSTKLYKIGLMLRHSNRSESVDSWRAFVFDANMTQTHRENAATYFYETFLGCAFPSDGAYETARFFDLTKAFIKGTGLPPERKRDLVDSLFVFVRDEQEPTFTIAQYNERFMPQELRDPYAKHMRSQRFRDTAIRRDTSGMGSRLQRRAYRFGTDVTLTGTPEAMANDVVINPDLAKEIRDDGAKDWTYLKIRRPFMGER